MLPPDTPLTTQEMRRMIEQALQPIQQGLDEVRRVLLDGDDAMDAPPMSRRVASLERDRDKQAAELRRIEEKYDRWIARLSWIGVGAAITLTVLGAIAGTFGIQALSQVMEVLEQVRRQLP